MTLFFGPVDGRQEANIIKNLGQRSAGQNHRRFFWFIDPRFGHPRQIAGPSLVDSKTMDFTSRPRGSPTIDSMVLTERRYGFTIPRHSMYAIYTYIDPSNHPNVGIYGIHGVSGICFTIGVRPPLHGSSYRSWKAIPSCPNNRSAADDWSRPSAPSTQSTELVDPRGPSTFPRGPVRYDRTRLDPTGPGTSLEHITVPEVRYENGSPRAW